MDGGVWTIPAERMKSRREHGVPLSARAREILAEAKAHAPRSEWVFPSARGMQLRDLPFSGLFRELGIAAVPHGFRSSFRDWAAEQTDAPHAVMEAALAHVVRNQVEAGLRALRPVRAHAGARRRRASAPSESVDDMSEPLVDIVGIVT